MTLDPLEVAPASPASGSGAREDVVLLDASARATGRMGKLAAHRAPGTRHLAFSVLLQDDAGRLLMQRRATQKHHFAGMWANSCCSHPRPGEPLLDAARRRLAYELGLRAPIVLEVRGAFWYRAVDVASGLVEHEYDVVLMGRLGADVELAPDPSEASELARLEPSAARRLARDHEAAAPWLTGVLDVALSGSPSVTSVQPDNGVPERGWRTGRR